jgi:phenylalanyl-tRNA synthetase beta chain
MLGILMAGSVWQTWWKWTEQKINPVFDFYFASGVIKNILPNDFSIMENKNPNKYYHPGKTAAIVYRGKPVGSFGVLRPDIVEDFSNEVVYMELSVDDISITGSYKNSNYKPVTKYPMVKRDISIVCDKKIEFSKIEKVIKKVSKDNGLLKDFIVFSIYESDKLGQDKISYSLRLFYKHNDRTLKDEEVNTDMQFLLDKLNSELKITLRT